MHLKASLLGSLIAVALSNGANANEIFIDGSKLTSSAAKITSKKHVRSYIVQLKDSPAISKAEQLGELVPSNQMVSIGNRYDANTPKMKAYLNAMEAKQQKVAGDIGSLKINRSYKHTFNGFSAFLSEKEKTMLENHPDVAGVWVDELQILNTANTPEFLGLNSAQGQHSLNNKGEGVIVGVIDTGIWPEHDSFADDGSYSDPAALGWTGTCDAGEDETFTCNNKLIGARYFKDTFEGIYQIQTELGEVIGPRDVDGHGSHVAGTAAGNESVAAFLQGLPIGTATGMAPRARVAAYKACWNSDYVSPEGVNERGCFYGDTMAAIDQAVLDGVDVINFSIGGSLTDLTTPPAAAMLRASQAGVFVSVSAGNSGPDIETVGTPAPWVTSVAASTYDGVSAIVGNTLTITYGEEVEEAVIALPAGFGPDFEAFSGDVVLAQPAEACDTDPLTNGADLDGKVALIARGSCAFTEKVINAQEAGATAVVVYTYHGTTPFNMGGEDAAVAIPSAMISYDDGIAIANHLAEDTAMVAYSLEQQTGDAIEVGNIMATFSSKGPNLSTYDVIKPDITAPGVRILAATTAAPMFGAQGESFRYLQGTSMSSPHIAGLAALFKESNPEWSPAAIKSALMTTARQNVMKEDESDLADPFNFGAGHVDPVPAQNPGLLYDANIADYLAFMCGLEEADFVSAQGVTCEDLTGAGFSTDPSQLNIASIAVAELLDPETVVRTVTNATDVESNYVATIEAPAGIEVSVATYDSEGNPIADNVLTVPASGNASYALTFTRGEDYVAGEWAFGSITWTDEFGHAVRSPIAIKPLSDVTIEVPETVSGQLNRGRFRFPVKMNYSGRTSIDYAGLVAPFGVAGNVEADPNQDFAFLGAGTTYHAFFVPEGTKVARFALADSLVAEEGADIDMYVYRCIGYRCATVGSSANEGSNEDVLLVNPEPAADGGAGDFYIVMLHGYSTGEAPSTDYTLLGWVADSADSSTRILSSTRAIEGRYNYVSVLTRGLASGLYMGAVTFYDADGVEQGTTVLEFTNP